MTEPPPPPPCSPGCAPPEVTHAEINITNTAPASPIRVNKAPVANLFGGLHGVAPNKRPLIPREKSRHTPARKKHGDPACRASAVKARVAIQEALSAKLSTLQVDYLFNAHVGLPDERLMIQVTPDGDDDNERLDNSKMTIRTPRLFQNSPLNHGQRRFQLKTATSSWCSIVTSCAIYARIHSIMNHSGEASLTCTASLT